MFIASDRSCCDLRPLTWGLLVVVLWVLLPPPPLVSAQTAPADSLTTTATSYWGPIPARADSVAAVFREQPRPTWENIALAPYWVAGLPFRAAYLIVDQTVVGVGKLGLFGGFAEYPGLPTPWGSYIMPVVSLHGLEGLTLGVNVTQPHFLGPDNQLFLRGNRSTKRAGAYAGGALFHLGEAWHLEVGGGFESANQTRYYGLGPSAVADELSYYYRSTSWGGFDLNRDIATHLQMGVRTYFSRVDAHESSFNETEALDLIHAGRLPRTYPGESSGWTLRWGLTHTSTERVGRPHGGGFQGVGVSLFQATDDSEVSYLTWHVNLERFFTLWHSDRTLAVRAFGNRITSVGEGEVPFTRLITFQRPDQLRGFSSFRFYGLGSVGVSVEYRWPLWVVRGRQDMGVDAYLFSDSGQVFDHTAEISLDNYQWTGGGGLRLVNAAEGLDARFELGFGDEDVVVRLTFSQTFQYNPRGFLYGKNPTKLR